MNFSERRQRFRALLETPHCVRPGNVFDPISARIAQDLGYEAIVFGGSVVSMTVLGTSVAATVTLTEMADQVRRICRASNLPFLVDADHGYGNALNVMRTIEELETVGAGGLMLHDTLLPAAYGAQDETQLLSIEEAAAKVRAAVAARQDSGLVIMARTTLMPGTGADAGIDGAIARARAYRVAGADALMFSNVKTAAQINAIAAALPPPLILATVPSEIVDLADFARKGIRMSMLGHQPFLTAMQAIHDTMKALRAGTPPEKIANKASPELVARVTRAANYAEWAKDYLG